MNEMEHKGNWSPPIADEGYILVPSNEGFINKFFKDDGTRVSGWQYPQSENSLGSFYGHMVLNDGVLFGSGYGNGEGKRCQNRKCISNIFAIDIESSQSIWMEGMLKIDGSIVGGLVSHENIIYFAVNTNDSSSGVGSHIYAVDATSDYDKKLGDLTNRILWKQPIESKVFSTPLIDGENNILILGVLEGQIMLLDISTDSKKRSMTSIDTGFPVVSSVIDVGEGIYCYGNINGRMGCITVSRNSQGIFDIEQWNELQLDGWIWSSAERDDRNLYLVTLSGWVYRLDIDIPSKSIDINWKKELKFDGKPVGGLTLYSWRNRNLLAVPFDDDKVITLDAMTGSIDGEFPLKEGVQSKPLIIDNLMYVLDRKNNFQSFSLGDRSLIKCFNLEDMKACD